MNNLLFKLLILLAVSVVIPRVYAGAYVQPVSISGQMVTQKSFLGMRVKARLIHVMGKTHALLVLMYYIALILQVCMALVATLAIALRLVK